MAIDVLCLSEEQKQNLNDLVKACRFLLEVKRLRCQVAVRQRLVTPSTKLRPCSTKLIKLRLDREKWASYSPEFIRPYEAKQSDPRFDHPEFRELEKNMNGTVLEFDPTRGFGWVLAENGRRYFAHIRNWDSAKAPSAKNEVVFDVGPGWNGKPNQCVNIIIRSEVGAAQKAGAE